MADPKRVDPNIGGLGGVADILNLFGGKQTTTRSTADIGPLQNVLGQLQTQDPTQLLQSVFQQAAAQTPGLQARYANALGARTGGNTAVQGALNQLLQDTALKGQQQIMQQQLANQQLQGQLAANIANATRGERTQSGTNLGRAATGLGALQTGAKLFESELGKKARESLGNLFNSGAGDAGANLSSSLGSLGDFNSAQSALSAFDSPMTLTESIGPTAADFAVEATDWLGGLGESAGELFSDFSSWFGYKDGGLVGRDGEDADDRKRREAIARLNAKREKQPSGGIGADTRYSGAENKASEEEERKRKMQRGGTNLRVEKALRDAEGYADGGQVASRAGGGRRSSAPVYTPDVISRTLAQQMPGTVLNPQLARLFQAPEMQEPGAGGSPLGGFTFGVGPLGDAAAAQNAKAAAAFSKAALAAMTPLSIPGITPSPISAIKAMLTAGLTQNQAMEDINEAPDPLGALAAAQGWVSPTAAIGLGSSNLAAAANAISTMTGINPMDALMNMTQAFGTAAGSDSGGLGGTGAKSSVSVGELMTVSPGESAQVGSDPEGWGAFGGWGTTGGEGWGDEGSTGESGSSGGTGGDTSGSEGEADGGMMRGKGTGTSDSIPVRVSNGEYIIPADVVNHMGVDFFDKLREMFHTPVDSKS